MNYSAGIALLAVISGPAIGGPLPVPHEVLAHFQAFEGRWIASGDTVVGNKAYPLNAVMNCELVADATAVLCNTKFKDRHEVMLIGYQTSSKSVWSEVVDSHDGATTMVGTYMGTTLTLKSTPTRGNLRMVEEITFSNSGDAWNDIGKTIFKGKAVASWKVLWKRN